MESIWHAHRGDDIVDLVLHDHRRIIDLVDRLENTTDAQRGARFELLSALRFEIALHSEAEDAVLYDRLSQSLDDDRRKKVRNARVEHGLVDRVLSELSSLDPSHSFWMVKVRVLRDFLEHHFREEQEELAIAKAEFDVEESMNLAQAFLFAKRKMMLAEGERDSLAPISWRGAA